MKEYNSILLEDDEAQFLEEITFLIKEPIKSILFPGDVDTALKSPRKANITFWYEGNHIIGLYFRHSNLINLPESIGKLTNMKFLILNGCFFIHSFPSTLENLQSLEVLILVNIIDESPFINLDFPDKIKKLKNLNKLVIEGFYNIYLPPSFIELENLEILQLQHCFFSTNRARFLLNYDIEDSEFFQPIYDLPDNIGKLKSLRKIILHDLEIDKLPQSIINLTSLHEVDLFRCDKIKNINIVFEIKSLKTLKLEYCYLKYLPKTIGNLVNLENLILNNNSLNEIPSEILYCQNLERLELKYNRFIDYIDSFKNWIKYLIQLPKLKHLNLNESYLKYIPKELAEKEDLEITTNIR